MDFSKALELIKDGKKMKRACWKNAVCVFMVPGSEFEVSRPPLNTVIPEGTRVKYRPHIDLMAKDGTIGVWTPSMADILADDWQDWVDGI